MTTATDVAAESFQTELDGILRGLLQSVNEEAAATVAEALDPTRESHAALLKAATAARDTVAETSRLTTALQDSNKKLSSSLETTSTLNTQLKSVIDVFQKRLIEHEKAMQTRLAAIEESVQAKATGTRATLVVVGLILLGTVIGVAQ